MSFKLCRVLGGVFLMMWTGCVVRPPHWVEPSIPQTAPGKAKPEGSGPGEPWGFAAPVSLEQAGKEFPILNLTAAIQLALQNNPDTRTAWAQARMAAANYKSVRGSYWPSVNINGTMTRSKGTEMANEDHPLNSYSVSAGLSYLLLDLGGRDARVKGYRQALLAAGYAHQSSVQNTILQAETAFFNHIGARSLLESAQTSLSEAQANFQAASERNRLGLATKADVLQAQTALAQSELGVNTAEGQVRITRGALLTVMGYPANSTHTFEIQPLDQPRGNLAQAVDQLIQKSLSQRPDLQSARANARQIDLQGKEARSKMLPSLSLAGNAGRLWLGGNSGYQDYFSGSLSMQIPVFNGLSWQFDWLKARAAADAAREQTRKAEQSVILEVYSSYSDFLTSQARLKSAGDFLSSARQSEEMALGRYKEGVGSILDLLSAQQSLAQARTAQIQARISWFLSLAQLAHDMGILDQSGDIPLTSESTPVSSR